MAIDTAPFEGQLLPTWEQLQVLAEHNERFWRGHFSEAELDAFAATLDDEPQTFDNTQVVCPDFGSPAATFDAWRKVYLFSPVNHFNSIDDPRIFGKIVSLHEQTAHYEPGLHLVRMDLTESGSAYATVRDVQSTAEQTPGMLLAHAEGLALVGLHHVFRKRGGYAYENLPYLPGYRSRNPFIGEAFARNPAWGAPRMDHGYGKDKSWGLRMFSASESIGSRSAVLLVHGDTNI